MNIAILVVAALVWAGSFYKAYSLGQDNKIAEQALLADAVRETREAAQAGAAQAIANLAPVNRTIVQKVQREIETNTVYRECKHTPAGLSGINEALTGKRPEPTDGGKLP